MVDNGDIEAKKEENFLTAYNEGATQVGDYAIWDEPDFTIFDIHDVRKNSEKFWKCDTYHSYAIGTTEKNADENNLRLWNNDIIFGFKASDTSGWLETDFNYTSDHIVRIEVEHLDSRGRKKTIIMNKDIMGGDATNGIRYLPIFPAEVGKYTIWINRVMGAGSCGVPEGGNNFFYKYELEIKPPAEDDAIPAGIEIDYKQLRQDFENYENIMANLQGEQVAPITPLRLFGTGVIVSVLAYTIFSLFK
jgi:hypothetical protein